MAYIERLADHHHTGAFSSETPLLDDFLRNEAYFEDEDYGITWVVVPERGSAEVMAYYTLVYPYEPTEEDDDSLADPSLELRCLAVDTRYQNTGVGTRILRGLIDRILDSLYDYPIKLLLLVAFSLRARAWYLRRSLGFQSAESPADRMTLYVTVDDLRRLHDADPLWDEERYTLPEFFWRTFSASAEDEASQ